ncbi:iron(III) transport system permease protein [Paenibacillus catalpae]|uniref:Iron(III) transport system permease protein n=1 Tax=Paenibacillus catalpae TaxID=1045775 RepID=A0A1I2E2N6_9BACL|nr:iron ABC transporter permease [Paenibacillus catalpae]SFE87085.1 iron(III) transport system permease protein [Paenibacillus catalpae]
MANKPAVTVKRPRLHNQTLNWLTNPVHLIGLAALLFLAYTIVWPVLKILYTTFLWRQQDVRLTGEADPGHFTLYHWTRVLASDMSMSLFYKPILNSLGVGFAVSALSMLLGCGLAWLVVRTNIPWKKTISFLAVIPYLLPSWILSQAWLTFFKNGKIGGTPGILQALLHVSPPDWLSYGFVPIVISLSIHDSVFFFLIVGAALSSMNSQLEEAASVSGAKRLTVLRRIVFPLVLPSILSGFILIFTKAISSYGVPALLGTPVNFYMISTMLYSSMRSRLTTEANVLSLTLMIISMVTIYLNQRVVGRRRSFVTVTGKDSARTLTSLGRWRYPAAGMATAGMIIISVVPLLVLLLQSFMLKEGEYSLSNFTMHYWWGGSNPDINTGEKGVFQNPIFILALKNSLYIAGVSSVIAAVIGLILGYVVARGRQSWLGRAVDQVSFLPYLIPGISLAAIYISMFAKPTFIIPALYGTITLLILITVVKELPFTVKAGSASMMQIGRELEEAAQISGASWFTRFRRILLPLNRKSLMSAFLLVFIGAMKEMELIILLITPRTETLTTITFYYAEKGYEQLMNVILMIIIAIVMTVYFLAVKFGKADLTQGIGGQ